MLKKRKVRELAMQVLFVWDAHNEADVDLARQLVTDGTQEPEVRQQAIQWATNAWEQRQIADQWVERLAPQWPPRRQPGVDRNVLRLAVWELTNADTPPKVVLDEAIELAKHFSTEQSASFVNGVLDAVLKEKNALTQGSGFGVQGSDTEPKPIEPPPPGSSLNSDL
jgi:N utilization substance protein B